MRQPTDAEIKKFWEWCGWRIIEDIGLWYSVNPITNKRFMGTESIDCVNLLYPTIDLDNIFRWAVPKLFSWNLAKNWELCGDTEIRPYGIKAAVQSLGFSNPEFQGKQ